MMKEFAGMVLANMPILREEEITGRPARGKIINLIDCKVRTQADLPNVPRNKKIIANVAVSVLENDLENISSIVDTCDLRNIYLSEKIGDLILEYGSIEMLNTFKSVLYKHNLTPHYRHTLEIIKYYKTESDTHINIQDLARVLFYSSTSEIAILRKYIKLYYKLLTLDYIKTLFVFPNPTFFRERYSPHLFLSDDEKNVYMDHIDFSDHKIEYEKYMKVKDYIN